MKKFLAISLGLIATSWVWAEKLTLQGSTTVLPIAQAAAEAFMDRNPSADITVRGGGSGVGIAALIDRATDIADASRPMKAKEVKQARERGINPVEHIIARDGIAIVVHPDNPISGLTLDQLKAIYSGDISRWNDLGIQKGQIVVVSRDVTSGTFEVFNEKVLKGARLREDALMQASNLEVATTVAKTPGAIGYVGLGYLSDEVKALKIDGIEPTEETVRSGRYPLARPLYMYTNGEPKGLAARFIQFVLSPDGQKIAKDQGFVPLK